MNASGKRSSGLASPPSAEFASSYEREGPVTMPGYDADADDAAIPRRQGTGWAMRCCCSGWGISTSCFSRTPRRQPALLGLTLTSRDKGENPIPMAGFPYHQLDSYLGKLIAAGYRAAVCEQVEDPKLAKGLVRREVTRVVTPGHAHRRCLAGPPGEQLPGRGRVGGQTPRVEVGIAWADLSTGRFQAAGARTNSACRSPGCINPAECLVSEDDQTLLDPCADR